MAVANPTGHAGGVPHARLLVRLMLDLRARALTGLGDCALDPDNAERYTIDFGAGVAHLSSNSRRVDLLFLDVPFDSRSPSSRRATSAPRSVRCSFERTAPLRCELRVQVDVDEDSEEVLEEEYLAGVLEAARVPDDFFRALFARAEAPRTQLHGVLIRLALKRGYDGFPARSSSGALFELNSEQRSRGWLLTGVKLEQWVVTAQVNEPMLLAARAPPRRALSWGSPAPLAPWP